MRSSVPLVVVVVSGVIYHLAQRSAGGVRPWPMLAVAYGAAFALTLALALSSGPASAPRLRVSAGEVVCGLLVGLAAFGIEAGTFYVYRAGWKLGSASVIASASVTGLLALIGVLAFREPMTAVRAAGLALAAGGAALVARGGAH